MSSTLVNVLFEEIHTALVQDEEAERKQRIEDARIKRQRLEENQWNELVGYFRSVPADDSMSEFTEKARKLYGSPRFALNIEVQEIFRSAIAVYPDKFYIGEIRKYIGLYPNDEAFGKFYVKQFLDLSHSNDPARKKMEEWTIKGSLYVLAGVVDKQKTGPDKERALQTMRHFCTLAVKRFPDLPEGFRGLLVSVGRTGVLNNVDRQRSKNSGTHEDVENYRSQQPAATATIEEQLKAKGHVSVAA